MKGQFNPSERDRIVGIKDGLADTVSIHERSPGGAQIDQDIVPLDGAKLCMITRDARIVDHEIVFQPSPDADDRLD